MNSLEKNKNVLQQVNEKLKNRLLQKTAELSESKKALRHQLAERKQAEKAFRKSERYHRSLFELSPTGLALCRMDGSLIDVNSAYAKILGRTVKETLKLSYLDITPECYAPQEAEQLKNLKRTGHYGPYEKEYIHKDGHLVAVQLSGLIIKKDNESFIWSSIEDITHRKRAEEEIHRTQSFLDSIIENIPNMIFVKDARELRFMLVNKAGEKLLGYPRRELLGKNDYDFFPKEEADFFTGKDHEVFLNRDVLEILEEPIHTHHGVRLLHTKKVPLYNPKGEPRYLLGISEDITEKKRVQKALLQQTEQIARSKTELEQLELFAFAATHDLQEPLRTIVFYADLLKMQAAESMSKEASASLECIQRSAVRMRTMMEQLRELSRIETGGRCFEKIELSLVIRDIVIDLERLISDTGGCIEEEPLPTVLGDPIQIHQLFQNLIGNGLKFHKPGEPPIVQIKGRKLEEGFVEILVQDNGIGFEERYLDRIFKPFQRLHGQKEYPGSGIGLAICQKIAVRHGGTITARSTPGQGSAFRITLPSSDV